MTLDSGTGHSEPAAAVPQANPGLPRDPRRITMVLKTLLWVGLLLDVIAVVSGLMEHRLLDEFQAATSVTPELHAAAESNDSRQHIIGFCQVGIFIALVIAFGYWIYVLNDNKRRLGATGLLFTPGWAVGWFFIPFANLWKPYQAMKELWMASANPMHWQDQQRGAVLPWWWFLWLLSNVLGQTSFRLTLAADTVDSLSAANVVTVLADCSSIALACTALVLISQITRMQLDQGASLQAQPLSAG